jgi:hypothetical protein
VRIPSEVLVAHGLAARMPPKQGIQAEVLSRRTAAIKASERVGRVLQGVERRVRGGRADYAAGSPEQSALIAGGGVVRIEQSVELWEGAMAEVVMSVVSRGGGRVRQDRIQVEVPRGRKWVGREW